MKLRPYQEILLNEILEKIPITEKLCVQLSTGGGKTVIFTELVKHLNKKTFVLVDSIDLVLQTKKTFEKKGIDVGCILAGNNRIPDNQVIIGMVKSVWNRKNKLPKFDFIIVDECHVWEVNKIFPFLVPAKIIGFTATPCRLKRYSISDLQSAVETMSDVYDDIVVGEDIIYLIENNFLSRDRNELIDFNYSGLKTDSSGEFTATSLKAVFESEDYQEALKYTFENYCIGKKVMIFTSAISTNELYSKLFSDYNVRTYDSKSDDNRQEVVKWFRESRDSVLINTGCFTKGFDVCDVEVILMARATMSLSLFIQIAGRGARITDKIDKKEFIFIDGGGNIELHGNFSDKRDWRKIFFDRKIKDKLEEHLECDSCEFLFPKKEKICPNCGAERPIKEIDEDDKEEKVFEIKGAKSKIEIPKIDLVFHYKQPKHTKFFVMKILIDKWVLFLKRHKITDVQANGWKLQTRFRDLLRPQYFKVLNSELVETRKIKYNWVCNEIIKKYLEIWTSTK